MIGLTPKSAFLPWLRNGAISKGVVSSPVAKQALKDRRRSAYWHFCEKRESRAKRKANAADDAGTLARG